MLCGNRRNLFYLSIANNIEKFGRPVGQPASQRTRRAGRGGQPAGPFAVFQIAGSLRNVSKICAFQWPCGALRCLSNACQPLKYLRNLRFSVAPAPAGWPLNSCIIALLG